MSEEDVDCVKESFLRCPKKSVRKANREVVTPVMTVMEENAYICVHTSYSCFRL